MTKIEMKSKGAALRSSEKKHRRLFSVAVVMLICCLAFAGAAGAADVAKIEGKGSFDSIQEAINNAASGDTITVMDDHNLDFSKIQTVPEESYNVWILVSGKDITIDLNGKTVTAEYSDANWNTYQKKITAIIWVHTGAKLTLTDSSKDKTGTLKVIATESNDDDTTGNTYRVNYMLANYNGDNHETEGGHSLVINGGTYEYDYGKKESAIVYSHNSKTTLITGGTFKMSNIGADGAVGNYAPWIFNARGNEANQIVVAGGTFNADVNHQHWEYEVYVPKECALRDNGDGTWTAVGSVAYVTEYESAKYSGKKYVRDVGYATVEEAVSNVGKHHDSQNTDLQQYTITLLKDADVKETLVFDTSEKPTIFDMNNHKLIWKGDTDAAILTMSGENRLTINSFDIKCEGYEVEGWCTKKEGENAVDIHDTASIEVPSSASLYAKEPEANTYFVTFDSNGGAGTMANQQFTYDVELELTPNAFTKTGYTFNSWNTKDNGSGTSYENKAKVKNLTSEKDGTVTLYANWTANQYTITVTSTEGGTAEASLSSAKYGEEVTLTASPEDGYSFFGWITQDNIELSSDGKFTMPAFDVTVEAVFKEIQTEEIIQTPSSSSGSEGNYLSYPRTTVNGGIVDFGSSKVVKALILPEGSSGSVVLKVDTIEKWPKALETEYTFDISVAKLGEGLSYIHFEIPLSTLESLELTPADICAYHFVDGEWVKLTTTYEVKDGTVCYESETDSFSPFKLVIEKGSAVPKAEENIPTVPPTEEPEDNPHEILPPIPPVEPTEPESPSPILAVFAGLGAAAVLRRK